jgi:hypothetical protein
MLVEAPGWAEMPPPEPPAPLPLPPLLMPPSVNAPAAPPTVPGLFVF